MRAPSTRQPSTFSTNVAHGKPCTAGGNASLRSQRRPPPDGAARRDDEGEVPATRRAAGSADVRPTKRQIRLCWQLRTCRPLALRAHRASSTRHQRSVRSPVISRATAHEGSPISRSAP